MWNEKTGLLQGEILQPYFSDYIMGGGRAKEKPRIRSVDIKGLVATADCYMDDYYVSPDDHLGYHFGMDIGFYLVIQTGIIHALYLSGYKEKKMECIGTDYSITCANAIRSPETEVRLEMVSRYVTTATMRSRGPRTFWRWRFELGKGAWFGAITLSFPFDADTPA
jgi:hypothetical protein